MWKRMESLMRRLERFFRAFIQILMFLFILAMGGSVLLWFVAAMMGKI